jgi:hypothetical protein
MKTLLTPFLLDFLIKHGYKYFLSRYERVNKSGEIACFWLTPISERPVQSQLDEEYETCFPIIEHSGQMALGKDKKEYMVHLPKKDFPEFKRAIVELYKNREIK